MSFYQITEVQANSKLVSWLPGVASFKEVKVCIYHGHHVYPIWDNLSERQLHKLIRKANEDIADFEKQIRNIENMHRNGTINSTTKSKLINRFNDDIEHDRRLISTANKILYSESSSSSPSSDSETFGYF